MATKILCVFYELPGSAALLPGADRRIGVLIIGSLLLSSSRP